MRKVGHKLDMESLQERWDAVRKRIETDSSAREEAERDKNARFFIRYALNALNYARLGYLFDIPAAKLREKLKLGLSALQSAVSMGGAVVPEAAPTLLAASIISEDTAAAKWIARLPKKSYAPDDVETSPAIFAYMAALQALTLARNKNASDKIAEFRSLIIPEKLINPKATMARILPIAEMLKAITVVDQTAFDGAWKERSAYWKKNYSKASEAANYEGILDIEGLGIAALSRREGLKIPGDNPYIPLEMLPPIP
jgi:hypothetical protein